MVQPTASDNCGGIVTVTNNANLPIVQQGLTVVTWIYTDENGNSSSQTQNVFIEDQTAPIADVASLSTVQSECEVSVLNAPTATDNCSGKIEGTHNANLPITQQGTTTVTWTYTDNAGNQSTQTQDIIILDETAPVADQGSLPNLSDACAIHTLVAPTATDNCSGIVAGTHDATLPITANGNTTITWTYMDAAGNTTIQTQTATINDNVDQHQPLPIWKKLEQNREITSLIDPSASDNCGGSVSISHNAVLPITQQGTTVVTWKYTDVNGNRNIPRSKRHYY